MASLLSHKSIVEICALIPRNEHKSLPNAEWRFISKHCVVLADVDPRPAEYSEYFTGDGFRIALGKLTLAGALDIVFSPGEPLLLWKKAPQGFIEGILERYRTACKASLSMRQVIIKSRVNITEFWINAYYTSFPCHQCSSHGDAKGDLEVFHLTSPDPIRCLSLKYNFEQLEVVNGMPDCHRISWTVRQLHKGSLLRFDGLRHEVWRCLSRADLDTCLLVNELWRAEVNADSMRVNPELALRKLTQLLFKYEPFMHALFVYIAIHEVSLVGNAAVDSAVVVNHLRNCATTTKGLEFEAGEYDDYHNGVELDDSVHSWISGLLVYVPEFRFTKLDLRLGHVMVEDASDFLVRTSHAICPDFKLCDVSLQLDYETFERLVDIDFLKYSYVNELEHIELEIWLFGPDPPRDHSWIRGLFALPNCKTMEVYFKLVGDHAPDYSEHAVAVLRETMNHFEKAADVSGFPKYIVFAIDQAELTWEHQEPTPTYSNVPDPHFDGLCNVYVTKNKATDVPLSAFVDTKEHCFREHETEVRHFIFRKKVYTPKLAKPPRSRKRRVH